MCRCETSCQIRNMGGVLWTLEGADKVLHGLYREEPLNWVLYQRPTWTGLGVQRGRSASSQATAGQRHKQQGAGTGYTPASFLSLEFHNEESARHQRH